MKNEHGFATIFGLCFILVVALVVKGIQESETNHTHEATDFQIEFDLQNMADGGIYEAAEIVRVAKENGTELLPVSETEGSRSEHQIILVPSRTKEISGGKIQLTVWGERVNIQLAKRNYPAYTKTKDGKPKYGYALFSVVEFTDDTGRKKFRRAFAYVIDGYGYNVSERKFYNVTPTDDDKKIHFLELPSGTE